MATIKKKFKDTDLNKTPVIDDMFWGILESFDAPPAAPVESTPEVVETEIEEETVPETKWDEVVVPDSPAEPAKAEPATPEPSATEGDDATSNEDLMKEFEKILFETDDINEAAKKLEAANKAGEDTSQEMQELVSQLEQFKAKEEAWKSSMQKAMEEISSYESERALTELEVSKKNKIYEIVMGDDWLKTLLALKKQAAENPAKEADFKEFLTEFYEQHTGNKISELVSNVAKSEKEALWSGDSWTMNAPWMGALDWVLEDL